MPIYEYECGHCGDIVEHYRSVTAPNHTEICERCAGPMVRLPACANFKIKGYSYANGYSRKDNNEQA